MGDNVQNLVVESNPQELIAEKIDILFKGVCKRILMIVPPQICEEDFDIENAKSQNYYCIPPYGFGLLCRVLEDLRGYKTDIIDLNYEVLSGVFNQKNFDYNIWRKKLEEKLNNFKPDAVCVTCMFSMTHNSMIDTIKFVKDYNRKLPIIVGGVHISLDTENILSDCKDIDFAVLFEADNSFPDMVDYINGKATKDKLTQIASFVGDEYVVLANRSKPSGDILNIFPKYHDLEIEKYDSFGKIGAYSFLLEGVTRTATILSNRGCRAACTFCAVRDFNGAGVRKKEIKTVADEMEFLKNTYGTKHIMWLDDDLLNEKSRAIELFNEIADRNLGMTWDASNGVIASSLTEEVIESAMRSGCIGLSVGIESGSPEILKTIRKPGTVSIFRKAGEVMKKYPQIFVKGFLMTGFNNENIGQILQTINLAKEINFDWYPIQILVPLPSTSMTRDLIENKQLDTGHLREEARFLIGRLGSQRLREKGEKIIAKDFENLLERDSSYVPEKEEFKDIWFLIDYHVNYERILREDNPMKLKMKRKMLEEICDRRTEMNALGNLFLGIIEQKLGESQKAEKRFNLSKEYLEKSAFWQARFKVLNLDKLLNSRISSLNKN